MEIEALPRGGKRPSGPDGPEAWCVALAACLINFVMAGLGRMSGILYVALIDTFRTDRKQASLPITVRSSMRNLLGPMVGILGQKYGVRPVIVVGGVVGTLSAAACFHIDDITWITVVWGGLNGAATSLITTLPQVVIGQHFERYRATASGMAFSGGCVGSFLFPALTEHLLREYDLGGTFLLIAGLIMHVIPAALLLRTPSWWKGRNRTSDGADDKPTRNEDPGSAPLLLSERTLSCEVDFDFLWENRHALVGLLRDDRTLEYRPAGAPPNGLYRSDDPALRDIESLLRNPESNVSNGDVRIGDTCRISPEPEKRPGDDSETVVFGNGTVQFENHGDSASLDHLVYYLDQLLRRDRGDVLRTIPDLEQRGIVQKLLKELEQLDRKLKSPPGAAVEGRPNTFRSHVGTALGLYRKPPFLLVCLCAAVHFMSFVTAVTTIVDFSMDRGLPYSDGKFVIGALSMGDLLGRLCLGWITDRGYVRLPRYMLWAMLLQGASTAALPAVRHRPAVMASLAAFGLLQGSTFVRHPVLLARYLPEHEQSIAMGGINLFSGLVGLLLPFYIGYFRDVVGSYDGLFYINGSITSLVGLGWHFEPYLLRMSPACDPGEKRGTEV